MASPPKLPSPSFCHVFIGLEHDVSPPLEEAHQLALSSIKQALGDANDTKVVALALIPPGGRSYAADGFGELQLQRDARDMWPEIAKPLVFADDFFSAAASLEADFYIFTNPDICISRGFYSLAASIVGSGITSWTAHRRTINTEPPSQVSRLAWGEMLVGDPHPGSDLFVMPRDVALKLNLPGVVMGMPLSGSAVIAELSLLDASFRRFDNLNLSFHYGDDRIWRKDSRKSYIPQHRDAVRASLQKWLETVTETDIDESWQKAGVGHLKKILKEPRANGPHAEATKKKKRPWVLGMK